MTFLPTLPRARAISLLRHRLTLLAGQHASAQHLIDNGTEWGQPEHVQELYQLWAFAVEAQERWLRQLVERLEAGKYVMADDKGAEFGAPPPAD